MQTFGRFFASRNRGLVPVTIGDEKVREFNDDIWNLWERGYWVVIPTNGFVKKDGTCVMGRGLALQAKKRLPCLPKELGGRLKEYGNEVFTFCKYYLITFPVKKVWWEKADLTLIEKGAKSLQEIFRYNLSGIKTPVYIPKVGCGNGGLEWKDVKPILEKYLDEEKFIVCDNGEE
jgi:hypothetical protein